MQFLHTKLPLSTATHHNHHHLSSSHTISTTLSLSNLTISLRSNRPPSTLIRMGGGPRTYPGGVSKWQWKRMQANKAKQLLKARLSRERHIYEMRKRAELMAAVSELERPWEVVKKAAPSSSALFTVAADEQLKVLADRFQKPGGYDMWSENDGPQIFMTPDEGLPTARFFPKGVVHSIRPYGKVDHGKFEDSSRNESSGFADLISEGATGTVKRKNEHRKRIVSTSRDDKKMVLDDTNSQISISNPASNGVNRSVRRGGNRGGGVSRIDGDQKRLGTDNDSGRKSMDLRDVRRGSEGLHRSSQTRRGGKMSTGRGRNLVRGRDLNSEDVYDMSMQGDGTYGFNGSNQEDGVTSRVYEQKMVKSSFSK